MSNSNRVTLSDIAEHLGLTKVSISKALRDHPDISAETKKRVREIAQEMGYTPNRLARSLSTNESGTIGVVIPKIAHNFFADALGGINMLASERGYETILCVSGESEQVEEQHLQTLLSLQVDGLLVSVSQETESLAVFEEILAEEVPLVFFDRALDGVTASRVVVDDKSGAYQATDHAIRSGHRTLAHLAGFSHVSIGRDRRQGYEDALADHGRSVDDRLVVEGGFGEMDGYNGMNTLFERGVIPDAIFAVTFPVALGASDAIREQADLSHDDIQVYSFGQHGLNRFFEYPHVSVEQPAEKMGRKAMALLDGEIGGGKSEPTEITISTQIVEPEEIEPPYLDEEGELLEMGLRTERGDG